MNLRLTIASALLLTVAACTSTPKPRNPSSKEPPAATNASVAQAVLEACVNSPQGYAAFNRRAILDDIRKNICVLNDKRSSQEQKAKAMLAADAGTAELKAAHAVCIVQEIQLRYPMGTRDVDLGTAMSTVDKAANFPLFDENICRNPQFCVAGPAGEKAREACLNYLDRDNLRRVVDNFRTSDTGTGAPDVTREQLDIRLGDILAEAVTKLMTVQGHFDPSRR